MMPSARPLLLLVLPAALCAADSWREEGFAAFADGAFSDGGANTYVSAAGRIQTVNRWDFNGDGFIELLAPNSHPLLEMLDMSIYWGNGQDFSIRRHTYVPADGPMWVAPGDLNLDGAIDLAVANYSNGTWTSMDSALYWGQSSSPVPASDPAWASPPFQGKTLLPSQNAQGVIQADLNRDGFPEVIFALSAGFWEYRSGGPVPGSLIYWNRAGKFSRDDSTLLQTEGATDVDAADVNGDGWPDLAFANGEGAHSFLYFGSPAGFSEDRRLTVPTRSAHAVRLADIDGEGRPDLLFAHLLGPASIAYLNRGGTFSPAAQVAFPTKQARDVVVADFNRDGFPDVFFTNHMFAEEGQERFGTRLTSSFLYWGSAQGFDPARRQELQTIGAWGANAADLNHDGWIDLLVCNFQEHYSFEVPSFIYWNGPEGFHVTRRTPLYEHGAQGNAIADFNGDGHPDILLTSMMGRSRGDYDPSYLYLGNRQGLYSSSARIDLPGREPYEQAMADLDDDGQVDVLLLNQGETVRWENEVFIFWNQDNTLHPWRLSGLPAFAGVGLEVSDLDRDGYLDLIVANNKSYGSRPAPARGEAAAANSAPAPETLGSFIYWGGPAGYVVTARTELPVFRARSPSIADLNADGHLDLVFAGPGAAIYWGDGTRAYGSHRRQPITGTAGADHHQTEIADLNRDGFPDILFAADKGAHIRIYYGDAACRYEASASVTLPLGAKTLNVADVDHDGWLDLVCPIYKIEGARTLDSHVLLGGPDGFSFERRLSLLTDGATGSMVSDFNFDGCNDIFFFCHRTDGDPNRPGQFADHATDSRLYWGGPDGFSPDRFHRIPTVGVHYDMGVDLGHILHRGFSWEYVSSPHDAGPARWSRLQWEADTPGQTSVRFQVRSAPTREALAAAPWHGPEGPGSHFTQPGPLPPSAQAGPWIQYKLILDTVNGAASPAVRSVQIDF